MTAASSPPFGSFERSLSLRYLRAKRQESGFTIVSVIAFLGIFLSVVSLVVIMSIMNGFRETLLERLLGVGGHVYVDVRMVPPEDLNTLITRAERTPGVSSVMPVVEGQALASRDGVATGVYVRGVRTDDLRRTDLLAAQFEESGALARFDNDDVPEVLVGRRLASSIGAFEGDELTLLSPNGAATPFGVVPRRKSFPVAGTFSTGAADYDAALVFMRLDQAQLFFGRGGSVDQLDIRVQDPHDPVPVERELRNAIGDEPIISNWKDRHSGLVTALIVERNMMRIVFMILVAITALMLTSGLLMLVKNKSRDIAILRTIGATRGSIVRIFFMAGASIGVLATAAGLIAGVLMCLNIEAIQTAIEFVTRTQIFNPEVYQLSRLPARLDWGEVSLVTAWALFMSFVVTLPWAWHASRLDPVEALRYE